MSVEFKPDPGNRRAIVQISKQSLEATWAVRKGLWYAGRDMVRDARDYIRKEKKSGKVYLLRKGPAGRQYRHQASAPGESPATFTGKLARGLKFQVGGTELEVGADKDVDYAPYLEQGTNNMVPRPYLSRTVEANSRNLEQYIERELKSALGGE